MKYLFVLLCLFAGTQAHAQAIGSVGGSIVVEQESDGRDYRASIPWALRGGYSFRLADVYLEYAQASRSDGSGEMQVATDRQEFLLWGKHVFLKRWKFRPFAAAGVGFGNEFVNTKIGSLSQAHIGETLPVAALVGGWQWTLQYFELNLETRLSAAEYYHPNPAFSVGLFAGFRLGKEKGPTRRPSIKRSDLY